MSANSERGDKKVSLSAKIPKSQKDFIRDYRDKLGLKELTEALERIIAEVQDRTGGSDALKRKFTSDAGLRDIIYPANGHDYSSLIEKSENLTLVFNDMRRWLDNHRHRDVLRDRITQNKQTRILLLHPKSNLMNFVAKISNKLEILDGKNRQVRDVERAVRRLCTGHWQKFENRNENEPERFRIIGHRYYNTYTLVMTESECWVVWYPIHTRYNDGVIFVFEKNSAAEAMYKEFKADIDELERVSEDNHRDSDLIRLLAPRPDRTHKKKLQKKTRASKKSN